jgi:putative Holliday junction resolvase
VSPHGAVLDTSGRNRRVNRLIGIDYGRKRLGLATCDPMGLSVTGWPTIVASGFDSAVSQVAQFITEQDVSGIVIGLPLNMDGTRGEMADEVERFSSALSDHTNLKVTHWDERLTSAQAKRVLAERDSGRRKSDGRRRKKGDIDRVAAALMLESYLRAHPAT